MAPSESRSWLLDGTAGWRTLSGAGVAVAAAAGIRLGIDEAGPLSLRAGDGSLGGLSLPARMAVGPTRIVHLLVLPAGTIRRFDPAARAFVTVPGVGGPGSDSRRFLEPANITIAGDELYVADRGNRQVKGFGLLSWALRHAWGPPGPDGWDPVDVAAAGGLVYVLDRRHGRLYRHRAGGEDLTLLVEDPARAGRWARVAVDRGGSIYLLDTASLSLDVFDAGGGPAGAVADPQDVVDRFDPPAIRLDHLGRFCLPESLAAPCDRRAPLRPPAPESPLAACGSRLVFDRSGEAVQVADGEPAGPRIYQTRGTWFSQALDSDIYRCQWHRVELRLGQLPPGTRVTVSTYADEQELSPDEVTGLADALWDVGCSLTGPTQAPAEEPGGRTVDEDFLVQSPGGQRLWLRVQLESDGYGTPAVSGIRVHYPRDSYLRYLPAVFSADQESRRFLERFLSIAQTEWDDFERRLLDMPGYFDPRAVPGGAPMRFLAGWLSLPLEGTWSPEQNRRLLVAASGIQPRRGTIDGLERYLRVYLGNVAGIDATGASAFPQVVEGYRMRDHLLLTVRGVAELGDGAPLWSRSVVGRLQLGVYAREGDVRLVSTGDPQHDVFTEYAHRFSVFVPAAFVRTADEERELRRAIESEKPVHTSYDLWLVEPRFRVGVQSTVGVDTILGDYPEARLACTHDATMPPSLEPRSRLGYDTVLATRPDRPQDLRLDGAARANGTRLT